MHNKIITFNDEKWETNYCSSLEGGHLSANVHRKITNLQDCHTPNLNERCGSVAAMMVETTILQFLRAHVIKHWAWPSE